MAGTVRMNIKNYEIEASAVQYEVLLVVSRICLNFAKDTSRGGFGSCSGGNVLTSPWAPQPIQFKLPQRLAETKGSVAAAIRPQPARYLQRKLERRERQR